MINWILDNTSSGKFCKKRKREDLIKIVSIERKYECGKKGVRRLRITPKITGGEEAEKNEFPWAAFVKITKQDGRVSRCGGTLISDRFE